VSRVRCGVLDKHPTSEIRHPTSARSRNALSITVLMGGPSGERAVSLESGRCVAEALESRGHRVHRADIAPENLAALAREVDAVFIALHGQFGEDGQVQQILERRGLRYVGSGPDAAALAMNKAVANREAIAGWRFPVVAKPTSEGSSLNCHIVRAEAGLRDAVGALLGRYGECMIEEFVPGLELTVGILGDAALPAIEIRTRREFYDYQAKYHDDDTQYRFDIDLPAAMLQQITEQSLAAHRVLGCRDFSRVDWRVDPIAMRAFILEVNVIPGMTSHSLVPKAAARAGISMPELCERLVEMALRRKTS
jgi:D-alanine-D-alanine ligase